MVVDVIDIRKRIQRIRNDVSNALIARNEPQPYEEQLTPDVGLSVLPAETTEHQKTDAGNETLSTKGEIKTESWLRSHGGHKNQKFSSSDIINEDNINNLKMNETYHYFMHNNIDDDTQLLNNIDTIIDTLHKGNNELLKHINNKVLTDNEQRLVLINKILNSNYKIKART